MDSKSSMPTVNLITDKTFTFKWYRTILRDFVYQIINSLGIKKEAYNIPHSEIKKQEFIKSLDSNTVQILRKIIINSIISDFMVNNFNVKKYDYFDLWFDTNLLKFDKFGDKSYYDTNLSSRRIDPYNSFSILDIVKAFLIGDIFINSKYDKHSIFDCALAMIVAYDKKCCKVDVYSRLLVWLWSYKFENEIKKLHNDIIDNIDSLEDLFEEFRYYADGDSVGNSIMLKRMIRYSFQMGAEFL